MCRPTQTQGRYGVYSRDVARGSERRIIVRDGPRAVAGTMLLCRVAPTPWLGERIVDQTHGGT